MAQSVPPLFRVRNWDELYENNRSRELARTTWFAAPNDLSAGGYVELVSHADGAAHLGVWIGLLMVASRAKPRGLLVREDGRPHTPDSLALVTRLAEPVIRAAIDRLVIIGLLEIVGNKPRKKSKLASHPSATKPQAAAPGSQHDAAEWNGMEHHYHEGKRTEGKRTQAEFQVAERPRDGPRSEHPSAGCDETPFSEKGADDDGNPGTLYASPEDELKAIYESQAGKRITIEVLDAIRTNLSCTGVDMGDFVAEAKRHAQNSWRNPAGFLRDLSRRYRAKTLVASAPLTAAEAEVKNYRCSRCNSIVRGEGAVLDSQGKAVPCTCASPEWIARQRTRRVFAEEPTR